MNYYSLGELGTVLSARPVVPLPPLNPSEIVARQACGITSDGNRDTLSEADQDCIFTEQHNWEQRQRLIRFLETGAFSGAVAGAVAGYSSEGDLKRSTPAGTAGGIAAALAIYYALKSQEQNRSYGGGYSYLGGYGGMTPLIALGGVLGAGYIATRMGEGKSKGTGMVAGIISGLAAAAAWVFSGQTIIGSRDR